MANLRREAPSQRLHFRINAPATVTIKDVKYPTADWSMGGFRVVEFAGEANAGDRLAALFDLNFQGFHISFEKEIEVIRISDDRTLAARFIDISDREAEVLRHFVDGLVKGEMISVGDTIKRIDTPVTPTPGAPKPGEGKEIPLRRRSLRRIIFSSIYFIIGGAIVLFVLATLYGHFFRLNIESAVVAMAVEPILSKDRGDLEKIYVQEGTEVRSAGIALFRLEDDEFIRDLETAVLRLHSAKATLRNVEFVKRYETRNLADYSKITQHKLAVAREKVASLTKQLGLAETDLNSKRLSIKDRVALLTAQSGIAESELEKKSTLFKKGMISELAVDEAKSKLIDAQNKLAIANESAGDEVKAKEAGYLKINNDLAEAKEELRIAEIAVQSVERGYFYDGERLVGDVSRIDAEVAEARELVRTAEEEVSIARKRIERLTYRAPFPGKVIKILKSQGNTVERGEMLMLLEHKLGQPTVDAFLTQDQITHVKVGSKATVTIPALEKSFQAEVAKVDRTQGFVDEMRARYSWRGSSDRSAYVQLVFKELNEAGGPRPASGMAAIVDLPKGTRILGGLFH